MKTYIKAKETEDGIILKYRDENDKIVMQNLDFVNYFYIQKDDFDDVKTLLMRYCSKATLYNATNGEFVKLYLKNNLERNSLKKALEFRGIQHYEADINAVKRFLIEKVDEFEFGKIKYLWYDIETDDRGEFEKDKSGTVIAGNKQILSIAMKDENDNVWFFYNKNPDGDGKEEFEMLEQAFEVMKEYDVVAAWNGKQFDRPYIEQRLNSLSKKFDVSKLRHIFEFLIHIDELLKFKFLIWGHYNSYSLENIANDILSDGKIDFRDEVEKGRGKFYQLFKTNLELFKKYNIKDVDLMKRIDENRGHLNIAKHLSSFTKTPFESFMYNSHLLDYILLRRYYKKNRICRSKPTQEEAEKLNSVKVGGGYTFCYESGFHENVEVFDFKSMYPLIMSTYNISAETYVMNMYPSIEEVKEYFTNKEFEFLVMILERSIGSKNYTNKEIEQFLNNNNLNFDKIMFKFIDKYQNKKALKIAKEKDLILTPADLNRDTNGIYFHPHRFYKKELGELATLVGDAVVERDKIKYKLWEMKKRDPNVSKTQEFHNLTMEQYMLKTLANSAYGFSGLKISRFFEWNIADAITTCARWQTKKSILFAQRKGYLVTSGDTDSVFLKNISFPGSIKDMDIEFYKYYKNELFNNFNLENFREFKFKNPETEKLESHHYFCVFEWEKSFKSLIIVAKKRYYYLNEYDEIWTQGGAFKKSDVNPLAKKLQKELCTDILQKTFDKDKWYDKIKSYKDLCFSNKLDVEYLVFTVAYTRHWSSFGGDMIDSKTGKPKLKADGSVRQKNIPAYIKLAKRLEEQGKEIPIGDKILYIIGKPKLIDLAPGSRKKIDRERFFELYNKYKDLNRLKQELKKNNILYKEVYETTQRAITIDEYKNGEEYDAKIYWSRITKPLIEILHVYDKELCYKTYADLWNMTKKQIEKIVNLKN